MTDMFAHLAEIDPSRVNELINLIDELGSIAPDWLFRELADELMNAVVAFPPTAELAAEMTRKAGLSFPTTAKMVEALKRNAGHEPAVESS